MKFKIIALIAVVIALLGSILGILQANRTDAKNKEIEHKNQFEYSKCVGFHAAEYCKAKYLSGDNQ